MFPIEINVDKETSDEMLNVITKVYDKSTKRKEGKVTLKNF